MPRLSRRLEERVESMRPANEELRRRYDAGESTSDLARAYSVGRSRMRSWLAEAGVQLRPRGRKRVAGPEESRRRVVAQEQVTVAQRADGTPVLRWVDRLECGHQMPSLTPAARSPLPVEARRCVACAGRAG